jgi:hypothetical protein
LAKSSALCSFLAVIVGRTGDLDPVIAFVGDPIDRRDVMDQKNIGVGGLAMVFDELITALDENDQFLDQGHHEAVFVDLEILFGRDRKDLIRGDVAFISMSRTYSLCIAKLLDRLGGDLLG